MKNRRTRWYEIASLIAIDDRIRAGDDVPFEVEQKCEDVFRTVDYRVMQTAKSCVCLVDEALATAIATHLHVFEVLVHKLHIVVPAGAEP